MKVRLFAGLFSLFLVVLVIVGPVYLSEKLEAIETSRSGLIPFEEVVSENSSSTSYEPFIQFSEDNINQYLPTAKPLQSGWMIYDGTNYIEPIKEFDVEGTTDLMYYGSNIAGTPYLYFFMELSAQDCLTDNAILFTFMMNCDINYNIHSTMWRGLRSDFSSDYQTSLTYPIDISDTWKTEVYSGKHYYNVTFDENDLSNGATTQDGATYKIVMIMLKFGSGYTANTLVYSDLQISPQYYEEETTTWNNETKTTYVPYIQSLTPYSVHKVSMCAGGILIFLVGLLASPLPIGNAFNGIFPINNQKRRRSR